MTTIQSLRALCLLLLLPLCAWPADDYQHRVDKILMQTPLIDGHNDLPWEIRDRYKSDFDAIDLGSDTRPFAAARPMTLR